MAMKPSVREGLVALLVANITRRLEAKGDIVTNVQTAHEDSASDAEQEEFLKASFNRLEVLRRASSLRRSQTPSSSSTVDPVDPSTKVAVSKKISTPRPKRMSSVIEDEEPASSTLQDEGFEVIGETRSRSSSVLDTSKNRSTGIAAFFIKQEATLVGKPGPSKERSISNPPPKPKSPVAGDGESTKKKRGKVPGKTKVKPTKPVKKGRDPKGKGKAKATESVCIQ